MSTKKTTVAEEVATVTVEANVKKSKKSKKDKRNICREMAKASEGKFSTDQTRILSVMKMQGATVEQGNPMTRKELKEACGIKGLYSSGWLRSLFELGEKKLVSIYDEAGEKGKQIKFHILNRSGVKAIEKLEAIVKAK